MPIIASPPQPTANEIIDLTWSDPQPDLHYEWKTTGGDIFGPGGKSDTDRPTVSWDTGEGPADREITLEIRQEGSAGTLTLLSTETLTIFVPAGRRLDQRPLDVRTTLARSAAQPSGDQALWAFIRNRTQAIGFDTYSDYLDELARLLLTSSDAVAERLGGSSDLPRPLKGKRVNAGCALSHGTYGYDLLRLATEVFMIFQCGAEQTGTGPEGQFDERFFDPDRESGRLGYRVTLAEVEQKLREYLGLGGGERLPYLNRILRALFRDRLDDELTLGRYHALLECRAECPVLIELIWSYWHEEGMLNQSMNAIALRFQNKRRSTRDPLARLEIDPLRPLNNLLWGYIQNEYRRLSVVRRAYEYDHHYGLALKGKAIPPLETADSRSKFLETFHDLLAKTAAFYRADADTTVVADAFPVLNALKDLHLVLAEGAHNQFGDLPWTARVEMLIEQWLLARPEMREFLGGRVMVPYAEAWMGQVDTMKRLQGWSPTTVTHFRDLGVFGEQILLSGRYGDWSGVVDEAQAKNWARYWKPEIQGYIHAYHAATGVDQASAPAGEADLARRRALPAALLAQRMAVPMPRLPAPAAS